MKPYPVEKEYVGASKIRRQKKNSRLKQIVCATCGLGYVPLYGHGDKKYCGKHIKKNKRPFDN